MTRRRTFSRGAAHPAHLTSFGAPPRQERELDALVEALAHARPLLGDSADDLFRHAHLLRDHLLQVPTLST